MRTNTYTNSTYIRFYEKLIALYPRSYLKNHRDELIQNFVNLEHDIGSGRALWTFIISDLLTSLTQQYMEYIKHHRWIQILLVLFVFMIGLSVWQFTLLHKAHSSFANYAAFRGCEQITSQTDATGTCITDSGQHITIVKIDGRWFLQGDGPGIW